MRDHVPVPFEPDSRVYADGSALSRYLEGAPSGADWLTWVDGHADEPHVAKALAALKKRSSLFRVLGSYPRAVS